MNSPLLLPLHSTLFIQVVSITLNNLLNMYRYSLNPSLNLLLWHVVLALDPRVSQAYIRVNRAILRSLRFHPKPSRLNSIKIRRVVQPIKLCNHLQVLEVHIVVASMW
jgi:hypothetical protein